MTTTKVKIPVKVKEEISLSQLETWTSKNTSPTDYLETLRKNYTVDSTKKEIEGAITALGMVDPEQCLNDIKICDTIKHLSFFIVEYFPKQFDMFDNHFSLLLDHIGSLEDKKEFNDVEELAHRYIEEIRHSASLQYENNQFVAERKQIMNLLKEY
ncbi:hypothetical protein ABEV09_07290 [Schinkia azotoformans]|uniref:hypothetical protein n=1 Tax=Schinkia azotoformans TaxID=1454 RepID=UPI002DB5A4E4|nr:hypothetical protein [Schinkia azotoformans]MEC1717213.1 hypothetical protein [Schinkia azotoformans]